MASDTAGWKRFEEVTKHVLSDRRLFRSSAPNYDSRSDDPQCLTQAEVDVLARHHITRIISLNQFRYKDEELGLLQRAGISYLHLPVEDFTPPSLEQLSEAIEFYEKQPAANTLVHCGYGHGRTGTCVTALQLFQSSGRAPPESDWLSVNHVETEEQMAALRKFVQKEEC